MSDVLDILDIERPQSPEHFSKESIIGSDQKKKKKKLYESSTFKKPEGMHRELYALLYSDNKDAPPILPSDSGQGYKQIKAKLGLKKVRPWRWVPFNNPARTDGALLCHWRRIADEGKDYPFARFNKVAPVPVYSETEYQQHLQIPAWSRQETDHLFELCRMFDLRFVVIHDRWNTWETNPELVGKYASRTVEEMKERYYNICNTLLKIRASCGQEPKLRVFDGEHEKKRKEQLKKLFDRTNEQVEEEQTLLNELRKIEMRKREREKKTQDLQKLITAADNSAEAGRRTLMGGDKKGPKKKVQPQKNTKTDNSALETAGIKFPDFKSSGVTLRSQRMKLPASVGQKKSKAIEQLLPELGLELNPIPTEDICTHMNELRSDMVLLYELKLALATCEFELQSLRHQHEALAPGKLISCDELSTSDIMEGQMETDGFTKTISEIIDVGSGPGTPNRKRRAAIEQNNILKKIQNKI